MCLFFCLFFPLNQIGVTFAFPSKKWNWKNNTVGSVFLALFTPRDGKNSFVLSETPMVVHLRCLSVLIQHDACPQSLWLPTNNYSYSP